MDPYNSAGLMAVTLTEMAYTEAQAPSMSSHQLAMFIDDAVASYGSTAVVELAIALARMHLAALDKLAITSRRPLEDLLADVFVAEMDPETCSAAASE